MNDERVVIPKGGKPAPFQAEKDVDNARLLKALQTMDENANARMKELRLFLFFLPLIWSVVWGTVYFLLFVAIGRS